VVERAAWSESDSAVPVRLAPAAWCRGIAGVLVCLLRKAGLKCQVYWDEMDSREFAELHAKCWETLKHYVHEADRMCELFGQCLPEPSSIQFRSDIVEQRVRENNAYAGYAEIRRQLLEAVRSGYEPSD
jgi:hypothetical protein